MASIQVSFTEQISESRKKIQDSFKRSHEALRVRENNLLSRVEEIETEFNRKTQEMNELSEKLNQLKCYNSDALTSNILSDAREGVNTVIDQQVAKLTKELHYTLNFEWDSEWENKLKQLGTINLNSHPNISNPIPHTQLKPVTTDISRIPAPGLFSALNALNKPPNLFPTTQPQSSNLGRVATGTSLFNSEHQKLFMNNPFAFKQTPPAQFQFAPKSQTPLFIPGENFQFSSSPTKSPATSSKITAPFIFGQPQPNLQPTDPKTTGYKFDFKSSDEKKRFSK